MSAGLRDARVELQMQGVSTHLESISQNSDVAAGFTSACMPGLHGPC